MPPDFLHNHPQFADLIRIVAEEKGIDPALVEKDYWIMHCLYGLQQQKFKFALKGGTSLSKGHQVIDRFSEDIDILIEPPADQDVKVGRNQNSAAQIKTRTDFYDWLARNIAIDSIFRRRARYRLRRHLELPECGDQAELWQHFRAVGRIERGRAARSRV